MSRVLDLYAGPGGWSEGLASLGLRCVGLELDGDACRTRVAAGHATVRTDVTAYPPEPFGAFAGIVASPPCQAFSAAGKREGIEDIPSLHDAIERCRGGWDADVLDREWLDARSPLVLEPLRWTWSVRPTWLACEQVPDVLPLWRHMADVLRAWGYDATALRLNSADYGVPQTRRRAFLLAHREGVRVARPTHAECPEPGLFSTLQPWVSMADALGWVPGLRAMDPRQSPKARARVVPDTEPSRTICAEKLAHGVEVWRLRAGTNANDVERAPDEPAPTMRFGDRLNTVSWIHNRPATSIVGTWSPHMVAPPGHREYTVPRQDSEGAVKITLEEAAVLQGFRADYPFQGSKTSRFRQVGNAVPPPWTAAIVGALA